MISHKEARMVKDGEKKLMLVLQVNRRSGI